MHLLQLIQFIICTNNMESWLLIQILCTYSGVIVNISKAFVIGAVDAKDGTSGDRSINIGRAVEGVKDHDVIAGVALLHRNRHILLLQCYYPVLPLDLRQLENTYTPSYCTK
jgi:hypothetical protein